MSNYSIQVHPDVESDYGDAYHWYELQQVGLGERFLSQVRQKIDEVVIWLQSLCCILFTAIKVSGRCTLPFIMQVSIETGYPENMSPENERILINIG